MPITFLQLARRVIEEVRNPLAPNEIWEIANAKGYEKELNTIRKNTVATLGAQLVVILPAKPKELVDREMVNKLATINPEFRDFLKRVKNDIASKEIRREMYDRVLDKDDLIKLIARSK